MRKVVSANAMSSLSLPKRKRVLEALDCKGVIIRYRCGSWLLIRELHIGFLVVCK